MPAVLLLCSCTESELLPRERQPFAVQFSASGIGVEVATRESSSLPLADETTLRILAFRRAGESPDLSTDEFMGEGTYKAVNGNGALEAVSALLLREGTYDFYALTPDLTVDHSGDGLTCTVSVGHGVDYATSLTVAKTVSEASPSVRLDDLGRRCTKLIFELAPEADNIISVSIESASLTNMTQAPVAATLHAALPVEEAAQTEELFIAGSEFSAPDADLKTSAARVILPRKAGKFRFKMKAKFNGRGDAEEFVADMPETLAFAPGRQYTFSLKMQGGTVRLELTVAPWNESSLSGQDDTGAFASAADTWADVEIPGVTGGGSTDVTH